ncbi:putative metallopeptidase [Geobacter anodireducens]
MGVLNVTRELERLIAHVTGRVPELAHIDPTRLLVCISSTRGAGVRGTYARIHPLRFPGGARSVERRRGRHTWVSTMPTIVHRQVEILYIIYFLVPRFLDLSLREKLITVFHELYHISPAFDGDIRRFPGRNYAHAARPAATTPAWESWWISIWPAMAVLNCWPFWRETWRSCVPGTGRWWGDGSRCRASQANGSEKMMLKSLCALPIYYK